MAALRSRSVGEAPAQRRARLRHAAGAELPAAGAAADEGPDVGGRHAMRSVTRTVRGTARSRRDRAHRALAASTSWAAVGVTKEPALERRS